MEGFTELMEYLTISLYEMVANYGNFIPITMDIRE